MKFEEERKHIHDLANSLSIVEASVSRVLNLLKKNNPQMTDEITRLMKANEYSKKSIDFLKALREHVHNKMKENGN